MIQISHDKQSIYPYYTICKVDSGQLIKIGSRSIRKKFIYYEDALMALTNFINRTNFNNQYQYVILKYPQEYTSYIVTIVDNGNVINIKNEI